MSEEIKFEKAMEKLEKIVEDLESGNTALDEALKKYEEGVKLSRICRERLAQAEKKIEILTRSMDGTLKKETFDPEAYEDKPVKESKSKVKPAPAKEPIQGDEDEEDLLF